MVNEKQICFWTSKLKFALNLVLSLRHEGVRAVMSEDSMRIGGQAMAAILGGAGMFYLWCSFYEPVFGLKALIMLGAATAISFYVYPESFAGHSGTLKAIGRIASKITTRKPRR
jgi:hypothetical protein